MTGTIHLPSDANEADIVKALADLPRGGTIVLPKNKTIPVSSGIDIDVTDRNITLDLNGSTLRKAGNVSVLVGIGQHEDASHVRLGTDGAGNTVLGYAHAPGVRPGSWVKVVSDDKLPADRPEGGLPSRMGQAMEVLSVHGNKVTLKGALIDQHHYDTNVRAAAYKSGDLVIGNGEIVGDQSHPSWKLPLLQLRSLVDPKVEDLTVRDSVGRGINVVDSVNAQIVNVTAKNLLDGSPAALGIAVSSLSSSGTTVKGLYAEKVTHAADNHAIGTRQNSPLIERYGGDIGMNVSESVAVGTRNFAWSWHSESINGTFDNVMAFDSLGFLMGRGVGGEVTNSGGAGNQRGLMFYEYGDKDSRDITVDGVTLKETREYSVFAAQSPQNNTISNSFLESYGPGYLASPRAVAVKGTTLEKPGPNLNDVLTGNGSPDMLLGGKGSDKLSGAAGNDYLWGGAGNDRLTGGPGRDSFAFHTHGEGTDIVTDFRPGRGGDILDLSTLAAKYGWESGDPVAKGYLRFVQAGADAQVQVDVSGGGDRFVTLVTLENVKASQLGVANLQLSLSYAPRHTAAAAPQEVLQSPQPAETQNGTTRAAPPADGGISDKLYTAARALLLEGGSGHGGAGRDWLQGADGADKLYGQAGDDALLGGAGKDRLYGGRGDDRLDGGAGSDMMAGSSGYDTADYGRSASAVKADLAGAAANAGGAAGDRYSSVENLAGSRFGDMLRGDRSRNLLEGEAGDDRLSGREGADTLRGGAGADWLDGGAAKDVLAGGAGRDSFYFAKAAQCGDRVMDFRSGEDQIVLSRSGFGLTPRERVDFVEGAAPVSDDPTLLWDRQHDRLLWDADGTGARKAVELAGFSPETAIREADILIA